MFHLYLASAYLYVLLRVVLPLRVSTAARSSAAAALLAVSQHHLLSRWIFGNMFSPELPFPVVLVMGWLFCSFVLFTVFVALVDVVAAVRRGVGRAPWTAAAWFRLRCGTAIAAAALAGVGASQAIKIPDVHRVDLYLRDLPAELDGFRVVQLSDLHLSRLFPAAWAQGVVDRTNGLEPDLILITGDLIDGTVAARKSDVAPLGGLRARHGVFASTGNHEYYFDYAQWRRVFEGLGIRMLDNAHVVVGRGASSFTVAGIPDAIASDHGFPAPDLSRALAGAPSTAATILLSHRPHGAAVNAAAGVSVQLSGHTHGGMVRGLDLVAAHANEGHVSRAYRIGEMQLYVSNGTGLWMGFPIRLGVPSEITEFRLRRAP